jgi:hypothetical protein
MRANTEGILEPSPPTIKSAISRVRSSDSVMKQDQHRLASIAVAAA